MPDTASEFLDYAEEKPADFATSTAESSPPYANEILAAYLEMRNPWQRLAGEKWPDTGLFFVQPDGTAWHPETISNRIELLLRDSGLPPIRFHDLRHCATSYLKRSSPAVTHRHRSMR